MCSPPLQCALLLTSRERLGAAFSSNQCCCCRALQEPQEVTEGTRFYCLLNCEGQGFYQVPNTCMTKGVQVIQAVRKQLALRHSPAIRLPAVAHQVAPSTGWTRLSLCRPGSNCLPHHLPGPGRCVHTCSLFLASDNPCLGMCGKRGGSTLTSAGEGCSVAHLQPGIVTGILSAVNHSWIHEDQHATNMFSAK
jgi:hypothetical protein